MMAAAATISSKCHWPAASPSALAAKFSGGTLGNTHFVAIPYNANAKEGALLTANFLISPEAQLRKQDPTYWGDPTVLSMAKLPDAPAQVTVLDQARLGARADHFAWMKSPP